MIMVMGDDLYPYLQQIAELIKKQVPGPGDFGKAECIAVIDCEKVLAAVIYSNYCAPDIEMTIVSSSPKWCKRGILRGLFDYPFNQLRCGRVTASISKKNKIARRFVERLGFVLEGVRRKARPDNTDAIMYGLLKRECRYV